MPTWENASNRQSKDGDAAGSCSTIDIVSLKKLISEILSNRIIQIKNSSKQYSKNTTFNF